MDIEDIAGDARKTHNNDDYLHISKVRKHTEKACGDSIIPGSQKIHVKTWGCSHNNSDSEYMAGQLAAFGYEITDSAEDADLILLNSCTVKGPAEAKFRNEVEKGRAAGKFVVIAGCVPQGQPKAKYMTGLSMIGVQQIDRVVEVIEETLKGNTIRVLGPKKDRGKKQGGASLSLPKIRKNPLIEIIAISTGCLNQCTYCKTKHARGELGSYSIAEIVDRAVQSFIEGVVEIWLTSEDTGAYGLDIGTNLPTLLKQLIEVTPLQCRIRVGMTNPPYIKNNLKDLTNIFSDDRIYKFLHIPVQSGSNFVLSGMKREYTIEDFSHIVDTLRRDVPGINIATDIISGFPTEQDIDHKETVQLIEKYKFASLFVNQFYARPGTPAALMERSASTQKVKERTKELSILFHSYQPYTHKLGETQTILVTELSTDKQYYVGHNQYYDQVLVEKREGLMGKLIQVVIVDTDKHYLKGKLINEFTRFIKNQITVLKDNVLPISIAMLGLTFASRLAYLKIKSR